MMADTFRFLPLLASTWLLAGSTTAFATTLERVEPQAVRPGHTTKLTLFGKNLQHLRGVWLSFPAKVKVLPTKSDTMAQCLVTTSAKVPVQVAGLRAITAKGISNIRIILVDDLPSSPIAVKNASRRQAASLPFGSAIDGTIPAAGKVWYRMEIRRPQRVTCEVFARRLGSPLDVSVDVFDAQGALVAAADDTVGLFDDCQLAFQARAGIYYLSLTDSEHRGGSAYRFRLRCGSFPLVRTLFPVGSAGKKRKFTPLGVDAHRPIFIDLASVPQGVDKLPVGVAGPKGSALTLLDTSVTRTETEPNDGLKKATNLSFPGAVSGCINRPYDVDFYRLKLPLGVVRIRGVSRRYGTPTSLLLKLCDSRGKEIKTALTMPPGEAELQHKIAKPGIYYLRVEELHRRGGNRYAYHVLVEKGAAGFRLIPQTDRVQVRPGTSTKVELVVQRTDYNGSILVALQGSPHLKLVGTRTIGSGKKKITLMVQAAKKLQRGVPLQIRLTGSGVKEMLLDAQLIEAEKYNRGNLGIYEGKFISDKKPGLNFAEYDVAVPRSGRYRLELRFAAKASRPAVLKVDGKVITKRIMAATTGGWTMQQQKWHTEQTLQLKEGKHVLRLERNGTFSHLDKLRLSRLGAAQALKVKIQSTTTTIATLKKQLANLPNVPAALTRDIFVGVVE